MKKNVGGIDKQIRYVLGTIFLLTAFFAPLDPLWRGVALLLAVIAFVTAITGL